MNYYHEFHNSIAIQTYSILGKKQFIDVHYNLNINKWTMSMGNQCNSSMNLGYDENLYRRLNEVLISKFGCSVPFLPHIPSTENTKTTKVCQSPDTRKKAYALYDLLKRNKENKVCPNPCSSLVVYFGIMFKDSGYDKDRAYLQLYLPTTTNINFTVLDYDEISMLADIGGYSGLLLGLSAAHLSKLLFKSIVKVLNCPNRKMKEEERKVAIFTCS